MAICSPLVPVAAIILGRDVLLSLSAFYIRYTSLPAPVSVIFVVSNLSRDSTPARKRSRGTGTSPSLPQKCDLPRLARLDSIQSLLCGPRDQPFRRSTPRCSCFLWEPQPSVPYCRSTSACLSERCSTNFLPIGMVYKALLTLAPDGLSRALQSGAVRHISSRKTVSASSPLRPGAGPLRLHLHPRFLHRLAPPTQLFACFLTLSHMGTYRMMVFTGL